MNGWRVRNEASSAAIDAHRRRMKSSWIGIGFSHHSVPSLSKTATRGSGALATNSSIAARVAVSFQDLRSVTGECRRDMALDVDVRVAGDVEHDLGDRAAGERELG